jgi:hypothetical protein
MSGFDIIGLMVIGLAMLGVVGLYRIATFPSGIWRESGRYQSAYLDYCSQYRKHDYEWKYMAHQRAMIMWFRAPLIEEFLGRAKDLRVYLITHKRNGKEALAIWDRLLKDAPGKAAGEHVTPESMVYAYDDMDDT